MLPRDILTKMTLPRILLTGGTGQVGSYLADRLSPNVDVIVPTRAELDLEDASALQDFVREFKPDWIVHPAAYTAVDRAESDAGACFRVNAGATRILAEEARRCGATLVTFSTDYVFDGASDRPYREDDPVAPLNVYGASKQRAEQMLVASLCDFVNLRTSWVYSARGHNFVKTMLRMGQERQELKVVDDQFGSPSYAGDLADAVLAILRSDPAKLQAARGTYHLAGTGSTTWFGFATHLLDCARELQPGTTWAKVTPVPSSAFPTPARRPRNSRLDTARFESTFAFKMPAWQDSARAVVQDLLGQS